MDGKKALPLSQPILKLVGKLEIGGGRLLMRSVIEETKVVIQTPLLAQIQNAKVLK
jgi:hypothetical protein